MSTKTDSSQIRDVPLMDALGDRYLSYALSTIMSRSLPDVRDGLKPVHRRLLYAMQQLRLKPQSKYKKSARVVGDVIGKFHPHGEGSIYDALVRLAQEFAARYPLIDGQGNFGNIDGDNAAAMRYTEARLTDVAEAILAGIDEDAVDFRDTYDGEGGEPMVLPGRFPNLLANGSAGIAVGMATSIPPHNLEEICDALLYLLSHKTSTVADLVKFIQGPDLPTGGKLVESPENILKAYETGRGSFRLRATWEVESLKGGQYEIVISEIPYQVQKSKLIERIADLLAAKKLAFLADVRDESTEDVRLILVPKSRSVDPAFLMETLFKQTDLETRISLNMNVLDKGSVPKVMDLREVLQAFLDHRQDILCRSSRYRLAKIENRLEILKGFLTVYLNLDEVIRIIRYEDEPKTIMMEKWSLSDLQAEAILNMRLRSLKKLEEIEIRKEHDDLIKRGDELKALLADESLQKKAMRTEIRGVKKDFGQGTPIGKRRTVMGEPPKDLDIPIEAFVEKEPVTVVCSKMGWIRAIKGHLSPAEVQNIKYKDGDKTRFVLPAQTTDKLLVYGSNGRFYTLSIDKLPGGRGHGEPIRLMIEIEKDDDVVSMLLSTPKEQNREFLLASSDGRGFIVPESELLSNKKAGKQVLTLGGKSKAHVCAIVQGDHIAVVGSNRRLLIFKLDELPKMARGRGVILQKYHGAELSDAITFNPETGLKWKLGDRERTETDLRIWISKRATTGRLPPTGFPKGNKFS